MACFTSVVTADNLEHHNLKYTLEAKSSTAPNRQSQSKIVVSGNFPMHNLGVFLDGTNYVNGKIGVVG